MSETSQMTAPEATITAEAVEQARMQEKAAAPAPIAAMTSVDAEVKAWQIYAGWRNSSLNGLPPDAFQKVEAAAPALISAIAAELIITN